MRRLLDLAMQAMTIDDRPIAGLLAVGFTLGIRFADFQTCVAALRHTRPKDRRAQPAAARGRGKLCGGI